LHPKAKTAVPVVRQVISLYRHMVSFYEKFDDGSIEVAEECPPKRVCALLLCIHVFIFFSCVGVGDIPTSASSLILLAKKVSTTPTAPMPP
jgi:hypothetical protein